MSALCQYRTHAVQQMIGSPRRRGGGVVRPFHAVAAFARASSLIIAGVYNSVRIGPRSDVTTSKTSTALKISSASYRSPAALRVS
jgi:hypothetical protein